MPTPRFMTHCDASRPKFTEPGVRREVVPKNTCILRDQQSDTGVGRTVTPAREAMWRNFGGSQAALITGHAEKAHSGTYKPALAPKTLAEANVNNNNNSQPGTPRADNNSSRLNNNSPARNSLYSDPNRNKNPNMMSMTRAQFQNPQRSSTPPPMRTSSLNNSGANNYMMNASGISNNSNNNNNSINHWSKNPTSTKVIPVEKNSGACGSRADSIVRGAPFPHHKNMVFPDEDKTVDTNRARLWMNRPLRNGQFEATRKRTYNMPTFRGSSSPAASTTNRRDSADGNNSNNNSMSMMNMSNNNNNTSQQPSRVSNNTGTSFLGGPPPASSGDNSRSNSSAMMMSNNGEQQQQHHFSKRKITVATHISGAAGTVTEAPSRPHFMVRPQAHQAFNPPYNETGDLINVRPQEVPQAAKHLGKRHMSPIRVPGVRMEPTEGGWSDQPHLKASGTKHYGLSTANSKDFPMTDIPPKIGELPKFRPSIVVMSGAPAFVPSISSSQRRASTPQPQHHNNSRSNSPGRRMINTPRDHDIFGAREQRQPWHPQPTLASRQPTLTAAPGSVEIKRCKGVATYSPQRVQPKYSF